MQCNLAGNISATPSAKVNGFRSYIDGISMGPKICKNVYKSFEVLKLKACCRIGSIGNWYVNILTLLLTPAAAGRRLK